MAYQREAWIDRNPVSNATVDTRATFIWRTYNHLFGAIFAFALLEIIIFKSGLAEKWAPVIGQNFYIVLGGFMLVSWIATHAAHAARSMVTQYLALAGYVVFEAIIFMPLLWYAENFGTEGVIESAAYVTLGGFAALTGIVFYTRKDFSFLRTILMWGGLVAVALIISSMIFGFSLGIYFSIGMVAFAGVAILYDTSNVLHHYGEDRYVAAALELFSSVAMLFYYVLMIFISRR